MLMFSRKGLVAFIGIGILLGILGPSDAIKCYECKEGGYQPCNNPEVSECGDRPNCVKEWKVTKEGEAQLYRCGLRGGDVEMGTPTQCSTGPTGKKECKCYSSECNTLDLKYVEDGKTSPGSPNGSGVSKTTASFSPSFVFGTLILACHHIQWRSSN